jgi:hypothetical protein
VGYATTLDVRAIYYNTLQYNAALLFNTALCTTLLSAVSRRDEEDPIVSAVFNQLFNTVLPAGVPEATAVVLRYTCYFFISDSALFSISLF